MSETKTKAGTPNRNITILSPLIPLLVIAALILYYAGIVAAMYFVGGVMMGLYLFGISMAMNK